MNKLFSLRLRNLFSISIVLISLFLFTLAPSPTSASSSSDILENFSQITGFTQAAQSLYQQASSLANQTILTSSQGANVLTDQVNKTLGGIFNFAIDKTAYVMSPFFTSKNNVTPSVTPKKDTTLGVGVPSSSVIPVVKSASSSNPYSQSDSKTKSFSSRAQTSISTNAQNTTSNATQNTSQDSVLYPLVNNIIARVGILESLPRNTTVVSSGGGISVQSFNALADSVSRALDDFKKNTVDTSIQSAVSNFSNSLVVAGSLFSTSSTRAILSAGDNLSYDSVNGIYSLATSTVQGMVASSVATSTVRGMLSSSILALSYSTSTGTLSLTSGYTIPLTASTTEWSTSYASTTNLTTFFQTPSTRITAGTGLTWSGNTLNSTGITSFGGFTGAVSTSSFSTTDFAEGSNLYFTNARADARADLRFTANLGVSTSTIQAMIPTSVTSTSTVRGMLSSSATGLDYSNSTGTFSLTSGYNIPTTASTTEWMSKVSSQWTTNANVTDISYSTGKVGIGTSSPSADLAIKMASATSRGFILQTAAGQSSNIFEILDSSYTQRFYINPSYAVYMNVSNGTFSTTSPALTVKQTAMFDSGAAGTIAVAVKGRTSQTADLQQFLDVDNTILSVFTANGSLGIGTSTPVAKLAVTATSGSGSPLLMVTSSTNSPYFSINSVGNPGIGTASSSAGGLEIVGTSNPIAGLAAEANYPLVLRNTTSSAGQYTGIGFQISAGVGIGGSITLVRQASSVINDMAFHLTNGSIFEAMRLTSAGNLGIGTSSPSARLTVMGSTTAPTANLFNVASSTNTSLFMVTSAGKVGIGTTTPTSLLHVAGTTTIDYALLIGTSTGSYLGDDNLIRPTATAAYLNIKGGSGKAKISLDDNSINFISGNASTPILRFAIGATGSTNGGTEAMRIDSSGFVGIGTTTAVARLAVVSPGTASENVAHFYSTATWPGYMIEGGTAGTGIDGLRLKNSTGQQYNIGLSGNASTIGSNNAIFIYDNNAGLTRFVLDSNGNIGIGSTTPSAKLAITGTAGTSDIFRIASSTNASLLSVDYAGALSGGSAGLTLKAGGTNQNIILTPSGTGSVVIDNLSPYSPKFTASNGYFNIGRIDQGTTNYVTLGNSSRQGVSVTSAGGIFWSNTTTDSNSPIGGSSGYTGISRNTKGALEINSGDAGTWRDLIVRNLSFGTTSTSTTMTLVGDAGKDIFDFASSTGTSLLRLTQTGNVGVGTSSPLAKLHVYQSSSAEPIALFEANTGSGGDVSARLVGGAVGNPEEVYLEFNDRNDASNSFAIGLDDDASKLNFGYGTLGTMNNHSAMTLTSGGSLGIGTSTPAYTVSVAGKIGTFSSSMNVGTVLHYNGTGGREYQILSCYNCGAAGLGGLEIYDSTAVASRAYIQAGVNGWQTPSDMRLKENIKTLSVLDKLDLVRGTMYDLKDSHIPQIGVIAQEIKTAFPEAVSGSESEGHYLGVSYNAIASIALQGVKELHAVVKTLVTKIENITGWFSASGDRFNVKGLMCVDDICVTKEQFKQILINSGSISIVPSGGGNGSSVSSAFGSSTGGDSSQTSTSTNPDTESNSPIPVSEGDTPTQTPASSAGDSSTPSAPTEQL